MFMRLSDKQRNHSELVPGNIHLDSRVGANPVQMETTQVTIQEADEEELIPAAADTPMSPVPADPLPSAVSMSTESET